MAFINYITGSNNGPGKVESSGFGARGQAMLKTVDKAHQEATPEGGAEHLSSHPATHDTFDRIKADQAECQQNDAQWKTLQKMFGY